MTQSCWGGEDKQKELSLGFWANREVKGGLKGFWVIFYSFKEDFTSNEFPHLGISSLAWGWCEYTSGEGAILDHIIITRNAQKALNKLLKVYPSWEPIESWGIWVLEDFKDMNPQCFQILLFHSFPKIEVLLNTCNAEVVEEVKLSTKDFGWASLTWERS